jgi:hypothetical protein
MAGSQAKRPPRHHIPQVLSSRRGRALPGSHNVSICEVSGLDGEKPGMVFESAPTARPVPP